MDPSPLRGLVAAPHTPFDRDGGLRLEIVERQADALAESGVGGVFIGGSTGEFASLTIQERHALTARWIEVAHPVGLKVVVHVGGTQVEAGEELARGAEEAGADAIAALAPHYYKPRDTDELVSCCQRLVRGAPSTPFYYYDIPAMTGVQVPLLEFAEEARKELPTFYGVKYTSADLMVLQELLARGDLDVLHGTDETLLAGLGLGVRGAVGSTYNLAPGVYLRLARAFNDGELETARLEQRRSVELVRTLLPFGFVPAARAAMTLVDVDVGPARLPWLPLDETTRGDLRTRLESIGFFEWRLAPELSAQGAVAW